MTYSTPRSFLALALLWATGNSSASLITVNSTSDVIANDGHCTLREAINSANSNIASGAMPGECAAGQAHPIVDTIAFNIAGSGVHTLNPSATLEITEIVKIDGYTQPGSSVNALAVGDNAVLLIEIASGALNPIIALDGSLFISGGSGSTIRGLVINANVAGPAIAIGGPQFGNPATNVTIIGNFIGVDPTGTTISSSNTAISAVSSNQLIIGGPTPAERNVIATPGDAILFNQSSGVIKGNYIGIGASGIAAIGSENGIELTQGANGNQIGGAGGGDGNVIFGTFHGINVGGSSNNTTIQGNYIGTDATGTTGLFDSSFGIGIDSSSNTIIDSGNVIGGNNVGIQIGSAPGTIIQGNKIGVGPDGTTPVPNSNVGILLTSSQPSGGGIIGGTLPGQGNVIANSCVQGISFNQPTTNEAILGNSIYANSQFGIALQPSNEPLVNDTGDADTGANNRQNKPALTSASVNGAGVATISGSLDSEALKTYRVEFFSDVDCHHSGFGEGRTFLGFANLTTNGSGSVGFGPMTFNGAPTNQTAFSATATDPDGNTSEFSQCIGGIGRIYANGFEPSC